MLLENTMFGKTDKAAKAIDRIRSYEPISHGYMDTPYFVAYSGGKDSDALRILFELSGVPYELHHSHTTVDAPETVRYVRSIPNIIIGYPKLTMWDLIAKKGMPPTRLSRYCCQYLKEADGKDRFVATGVRWSESVRRRAHRSSLEIQGSTSKNKLILNSDNEESRRMFEVCQLKGKRILNPIVEWSDSEVWEFLDYYGCKSNPLYGCGYKRVGCVGCPMAGAKGQAAEFERYPAYRRLYVRAFERMLEVRRGKGKVSDNWTDGEAVMDWWLSSQAEEVNENQLDFWNMERTETSWTTPD
ncbi:hypothetical protein FACS1894208_10890 [Clostridia bacterium]|nr:hypothetical protein FACS1894208_10890 [Clostridia bacterium]